MPKYKVSVYAGVDYEIDAENEEEAKDQASVLFWLDDLSLDFEVQERF